MTEFNNATDLVFKDISSEASRTYRFSSEGSVTIDAPEKLNVSPSGGHRIFSADGTSHYVPAGWIHLSWKAKHGQPHFVA